MDVSPLNVLSATIELTATPYGDLDSGDMFFDGLHLYIKENDWAKRLPWRGDEDEFHPDVIVYWVSTITVIPPIH